MYHIRWLLSIKLLIALLSVYDVQCTIDGSFIPRRRNATRSPEDPCSPLFWYPRNIPEYCYYKKDMTSRPPIMNDPRPIPMPIPVPIPPMPIPMPIPIPSPMLPPIIPSPMMPLPYPLPFGIPLAPTNPMLPVAGFAFHPQPPVYPPHPPLYAQHPPQPHIISPFASYMPPYGIQRRPMSMVPGLPGLVAPDGGINLLPFSDAYADVLERHKQKMIRKRLQKLLDEYDGWPSRNSDEDVRHDGNDINDEDLNMRF